MRFITALLLALLIALPVHAASPEEDLNRYLQVFQGDTGPHVEAVRELAWMGLSDPQLYDVIEARLLQDYESARRVRAEKNRVSHYLRALGFSGQAKYTPTLERLANDATYRNHASNALRDLELYGRWNPVIANRATFSAAYSDEVNRILNMLRSEDLLLVRLGGKRVYFGNTDEVLLEATAAKLRATMGMDTRESSDPISWLVKSLGSAKNEKYRALLEDVAANAANKKVRSYAAKELKR